MGRTIDADDLKDSLACYPFMTNTMIRWFRHIINEQESVDQKEGRWIPAGSEGWECSECWWTTKKPKNFCPVCGSRNRLDKEYKDERS